MEVNHKKIYILLVPAAFIIGFLYKGFDSVGAWEGDLFFVYIASKEVRFCIYGLIGGYMMAAVASGSILVLEYILKEGKIGLLLIFLLAGFCVGMVTLIPCYIFNLIRYAREKKREQSKPLPVVILISLFLLVSIFLWIILHGETNVGERKVHQATLWEKAGKEKNGQNENSLFYDGAQNAFNAFWASGNAPKLVHPDEDNEIIRFSDKNGSLILWASESIFDTDYIIGSDFEMKGELFSFPKDVFWQEIDSMWKRGSVYDERQRVVWDIVASYMHNLSICFGICMDDSVENMKIMGKIPDGIKEFEYGGKRYYLWYYNDGKFIWEKIEGNEDFENLNMDEAVRYLEISFL